MSSTQANNLANKLTENYLSAFAAQEALANLPWLSAHRQSAFDQFQESGFPTRRHENWKYTDVSAITKTAYELANAKHNLISKGELKDILYAQENSHEVVFINGQFSAEHSNIGTLPDNVIVGSLRAALSDTPELLETSLNQCLDSKNHIFAALNTAFFNDGAFIYVPDNTVIDEPVVVYFISSDVEKSLAMAPRNLIVMGKHAQAEVIESFHGLKGVVSFTNTITEIETAEGAVLEHYKVQQENIESFHIGGTHLKQHRNSRVESHSISLGGAIVRNDIVTELGAEGAEIILNGLYMGNGRQHVDNHTLVNHSKPNTQSEENYRGVLDGRAQGVFNGKVIVHKDAQKITADQSNANLLLSDHAEINTKPELEIYADDVKCSHGATIGQLDKNMLFYLRSRGLDEATARSLLTFAFADDIIRRIKFAPIREQLEFSVGGRLPDADLIKANLNSANLNSAKKN
jgi:Fe-S cluster assembly protein SufD